MDMQMTKVGRWSSLFGGSRSFEYESGKAKEIEAQWFPSEDGDQVNIVVGTLPGFATPAWGSDSNFLYIRKPDGVWKTRLESQWVGRIGLLQQKFSDGTLSGCVFLDDEFSDAGGWILAGTRVGTSGDIDALMSFEDSTDVEIDAEAGVPLCNFVDGPPEKDVVLAGCAFGGEPIGFAYERGILIATDLAANRRVAFDINEANAVKESLNNNRLWLRFEGDWMKSVDVKVELN